MSEIDRLVGKRIARRRTERGYTAADLAQAVGVSETDIATYEAGVVRPPPVVLVLIAEKLGISVACLFAEPTTRTVQMFADQIRQPAPLCTASNANIAPADEAAEPVEKDPSESVR